jgi:hypothetical protein
MRISERVVVTRPRLVSALLAGRAQDATGRPKHHRLSVICGSLGVADHSETPPCDSGPAPRPGRDIAGDDEVWASR